MMKPPLSHSRPPRSVGTRALGLNQSSTSLFSGLWPIAVMLLGLILGLYASRVERELQPFAYALIAGCIIALLGFARSKRSDTPLAELAMAPTGLPLAYFAFVLLAPLTLALVSDEKAGQIDRQLLTGTTILISLATVGGLAIGVNTPIQSAAHHDDHIKNTQAKRLVLFARGILFMALSAVLVQVIAGGTVFTSAYGALRT